MEELLIVRLEEHLEALKLGVVLSIAAVFIASKIGFFKLPKKVSYDSFPLSYSLGAFILYLTISIVVVPLLSLAFLSYMKGELISGDAISVTTESWINIGLILCSALALGIYLLLMTPHLRNLVFGENALTNATRALKDWFIGVSTWFLAFPITLVISQVLALLTMYFYAGPQKEQVAVMYVRLAQSIPVLFWLMVATVILIVPILEELLFRGFLQTYLKQYLGVTGAIISASIIFAFFHYSSSQGSTNLEILGSLFVLSCFLGFLFERQKSIWASAGLHSFFNFISIAFLLYEKK